MNSLSKIEDIVEYTDAVTLLGGAEVPSHHLRMLVDSSRPLICADGGGKTALEFGLNPQMIIGDMDSFSGSFGGHIVHLPEQDTTDFEKCLYSVHAPFFVGYGFLGGRFDHDLAALNALVKHSNKSVVLVGEQDLCFCCPPKLEIELPQKTRLSIFPMSKVEMRTDGLQWPLDNLELSPVGRIGTSNKTNNPHVSLTCVKGKAIVILPYKHLDAVQSALASG